jgi:hypothetical protein
MTERVIRTVSIVTSVLVIVSFAFFAADQFGGASARQQEALGQSDDVSRPALNAHAQPRRFVDGSAHVLLSPFASLDAAGGEWAQRTLPTALALLVYGFGLGFLARSARGLP